MSSVYTVSVSYSALNELTDGCPPWSSVSMKFGQFEICHDDAIGSCGAEAAELPPPPALQAASTLPPATTPASAADRRSSSARVRPPRPRPSVRSSTVIGRRLRQVYGRRPGLVA